jgi:outer membrane protein assembly factor BamB
VAEEDAAPPVEFGPEKALLWKTDIPDGVGSPCVWGDRVFVTAFDQSRQMLEVVAVDRSSGDIAWRRPVPSEAIEEVHEVSSPASSTPVTDGKRVYVYLGSYGLLAYEWDGALAWDHPMGVSKAPFGSGTSPLLAGDLLVVTRDYPPEPYMLAVNRTDGTVAWKTDLLERAGHGPKTSHATPVLWRGQIVVHRSGEISAYNLESGRRSWWVETASSGSSTPSPGGKALYVTAFAMLSDPANAPEIPAFPVILSTYDVNGDGKLSEEELPDNELWIARRAGMPDSVPGAHFTLRRIFWMVDGDKDGFIDEANFQAMLAILEERRTTTSAKGLLSIQAGAEADPSGASVSWTYERNVPEVPAPLSYRGRVYMIISGGILSCVDPESGESLYRGRVGARGAYYASPVAAGDRIFVASAEGVVTALGAGDRLEVLANNDLGDPVYGTPAPAGNALYVRSRNHLWAFGHREPSGPEVD